MAAGGYALAAVLVVMAAMLLLAVGGLALVGIERKTARSYSDSKRAEWVARAGLEDVRSLLREQAANDHFLVLAGQPETTSEDRDPLDYLYLVRGEAGGDGVQWNQFPLFSAATELRTVDSLDQSLDPEPFLGDEVGEFSTLPWADPARIAWIDITDDDDRIVGRYAFWVEDLQARLDATASGNERDEGDHQRVAYPSPAPGIQDDPDEPQRQVALFAIDPAADGDTDTSELDKKLIEGEPLLVSPDSVLAAAGVEPPLERGIDGKLIDPQADALERNVNPGTVPYLERAEVPFAEGISGELSGQPKLNLNALLAEDRGTAVNDFKEQVLSALPDFEERAGGFPDDYVATLAANALDYADADSEGSVEEGRYRGLDAYPLISEVLTRFRWEGIEIDDGRKYIILSGTIYAELWNMSDQPVSGEVQVSYETNYGFDLGVIPDLNLGSAEFLEDPEVASPLLTRDGGYYWLPPVDVDLLPNEYRLINFGGVRYRIDAGPSAVWITSPIVLGGDENGESGYRMKWNGNLVDQSRDNMIRPDTHVNYPLNTESNPRQGVWSTIPGHSYAPARFEHVNNMGDPRMAFYLQLPQDPNDYPDNYSPNRRTIRWGNIYALDSSTKPKVYGRVMPSEWPDCGHNTPYGDVPPAVRAGRGGGSARGDERVDPDDPQFFENVPEPEPLKAPMRISNRGRFYSATELGRAYDPLMWQPAYESPSKTNRLLDGRMPDGETWPLVTEGSAASTRYGGGNSLRIGRPEHPRFNQPGLHAAHLLDLFHAGSPGGTEPDEGDLYWVDGRVNLNTAGRDVLRALAVGKLAQDPVLAERVSNSHQSDNEMAPPTEDLELGTPVAARAADIIADAILRERPFASAAGLAAVEDSSGEPVFGNRDLYSEEDRIQWSDAAAEEVFARVYNSSTLRSRNFRVWVVGQALAPRDSGSGSEPDVLAEARKVFTVHAGPEEREADGTIDPANFHPAVLHENDF